MYLALWCGGGRLLDAQGIAIHTGELPWAIKGEPYHAAVETRVSGHCPKADVTLNVVEGELPKGVELYSFGFEGTPLQMGTYQFLLQASNVCGVTTRRMEMLVTARPLLLVSPARLVLSAPAGGSSESLLKVESSWPDLPYTVFTLNAAPWLEVAPKEGKTPDPDSAFTGDRVELRADAAKLTPGTYHAVLKFYAAGGENAPTVEITLQVHKSE